MIQAQGRLLIAGLLSCTSLGGVGCNLSEQVIAEEEVGKLSEAAARPSSIAAGSFELELDGAPGGFLESAEGGHATAEVVTERLGLGSIPKKHLGLIRYGDIALTLGAPSNAPIFVWIEETLEGKFSRKGGAIVGYDAKNVERQRLTFAKALLTEVGFPALDASSKEPAELTVKLSPEVTKRLKPMQGSPLPPVVKQKKWLSSNFRVAIDGLPEASAHVKKVEAFSVKQKLTERPGADPRETVVIASLEIPNLVFTVPESRAEELYAWHEDFAINGNNGENQERKVAIQYLAPDLKTVLFELLFSHCGIFRLAPEDPQSAGEGIGGVEVKLYCETIQLERLRQSM